MTHPPLQVFSDYATKHDGLTFTAAFISLNGVGERRRHATGFFWRRTGKVFLVTNWHVVAGINMMNGSSLSDGWCPESITVQYCERLSIVGAQTATSQREASVGTLDVSLYEEFHAPHWIQHKRTFQQGIDLVALEIKAVRSVLDRISCVNDWQYPQLYHFAGSEIFVLGHPLPRSSRDYGFAYPIWKRGSIASELLVPWDKRPAFLIDCRTSKGMSGSPVFSRVFGPAALGDGTILTENILTSEFMGVYSGRLIDDENNASLGLVWHRNLIDEILSEPQSGVRQWEPPLNPETASVYVS